MVARAPPRGSYDRKLAQIWTEQDQADKRERQIQDEYGGTYGDSWILNPRKYPLRIADLHDLGYAHTQSLVMLVGVSLRQGRHWRRCGRKPNLLTMLPMEIFRSIKDMLGSPYIAHYSAPRPRPYPRANFHFLHPPYDHLDVSALEARFDELLEEFAHYTNVVSYNAAMQQLFAERANYGFENYEFLMMH